MNVIFTELTMLTAMMAVTMYLNPQEGWLNWQLKWI